MARILVVDDEEGIRSFLTDSLLTEGHEVVEAADGVQGSLMLDRQHPDAEFGQECFGFSSIHRHAHGESVAYVGASVLFGSGHPPPCCVEECLALR